MHKNLDSKKISVVIPAYNAANFISQALDSIALQTLAPREVIVVDDGSTDETVDTVRQWIAKANTDALFPVHLLTQENCGAPATRNRGVLHATGQWIALLDADDIWEPEHLDELLQALKLDSAAIGAYGAGRLIENGVLHERLYDDFWDSPSKKFGNAIPNTNCYRIDFRVFSRLLHGNFIKPSSLLFSKQAALNVGLFNESLRSAEDREFLVRLIREGPLVYSAVPITRYRWHDENLSQTKNAKKNLANGMRALKLIGDNSALKLNPAECAAYRSEVQQLTTEFLYACSQGGISAYREGLWLVSGLFGSICMLTSIKIKHLIRCIGRTILRKTLVA